MSVIVNDISEHQGDVDWAAHRAGRQAVILRAHNGNRRDTLFAHNRAEARPMRLVGIYQYLVTDRDTAVQAREFVATIGSLNANEWPVLDIEEGSSSASRTAAWLAVVEPALGRRAWIYSGDNRWQTTDLATATGDRPRWVARYSDTPPVTPWQLWQRSSQARAPGVKGNVDESIHNGTLDQLAALTTGETDDMTPEDLRRALGGPADLDLWHKFRQIAAEGVKDALATEEGRKLLDHAVAEAMTRRFDRGAVTLREALRMMPDLAKQAATAAADDVDEKALATALAPLLSAHVGRLSPDDLTAIAKAVADEQGRRDTTTGCA